MKRRQYLRGIGAIGLGSVISGCTSFSESGTLNVQVHGNSDSIDSFRQLEIVVDGVRVKSVGDKMVEVDLDNPVEFDLTRVSSDSAYTVADVPIEPGTYAYLQLEGAVDTATLENGKPADFGIPGDDDRLRVPTEFEVRSGRTTTVVVALEAVHPGTTKTYVLEADASGSKVITEN